MSALISYEPSDRLQSLADEAKAIIGKGASHAIRLGEILIEARDLHPGDREFGRWCTLNFGGQMKRASIANAMALARHFAERPEVIEAIPLSGLYELAAPKADSVRATVVEKLLGASQKGVELSVKDCREQLLAELEDAGEYVPPPLPSPDESAIRALISIIRKIGTERAKACFNAALREAA